MQLLDIFSFTEFCNPCAGLSVAQCESFLAFLLDPAQLLPLHVLAQGTTGCNQVLGKLELRPRQFKSSYVPFPLGGLLG